LTNYGKVMMLRGDYPAALGYLERARSLKPDYPLTEASLGVTYAAMRRDAEAEQHFKRALKLADLAETHYSYGAFLKERNRLVEAREQLEKSLLLNPLSLPTRNLLVQVYSDQQNWSGLDGLAQETATMTRDKETTGRLQQARVAAYQKSPAARRDATVLTRQAAEMCKTGRFRECLGLTEKAIQIQPAYAEAYNNMAYALIGLNRLDEAVWAWRNAVRIKPDYELARKNLAQALGDQKRKQQLEAEMRQKK
jgi:tetratricopeptide (TPR) repeat protein